MVMKQGPNAIGKNPTTQKLRYHHDRLVDEMRYMEQEFGHHGVFLALATWLNKPLRSHFKILPK